MDKKENVIVIETDDGKQIEFRVLFTYHSENYNKDYVFIYDDKNPDNLLVYSSTCSIPSFNIFLTWSSSSI